MKILVTDKIADEGIESLKRHGFEVDALCDLTHDELENIIGGYDALIVRSATVVDAPLLEHADNLKIIGRAGVTTDNIDIEAASERNIVVCNAPNSNIVSAAEHTMALMLSAAREIPQANESMHEEKWEREKFMGVELNGKTLAIFGLGRVGELVAERARGFGMKIIGYDPYCSVDRANKLGVTLYGSIIDVVSMADFITVHLPRTTETNGMFGSVEFAAMKEGVILVNAARGGIFDEKVLADFIAAGKVKACALDVFEEEPCYSSPLMEFDNALLTPHIAALTHEAQVRASLQIAEYVWEGLEGSVIPTAINSSVLPAEMLDAIGPYVPACKMMGRALAQIEEKVPQTLSVELAGSIFKEDCPMLVAAVLEGILSYREHSSVPPDNVEAIATRHGISVQSSRILDAQEYSSYVSVRTDNADIAMTLYGTDFRPRIVSLLGYRIDIEPASESLIFEYVDAPGRIGTIGTILGTAGVNITTMQIGNNPDEKCALVYINVEGDVSPETIDELRNAIDLKNLWVLKF